MIFVHILYVYKCKNKILRQTKIQNKFKCMPITAMAINTLII